MEKLDFILFNVYIYIYKGDTYDTWREDKEINQREFF